MMPTVSFKNIKWCLSEKTSSCWRVQDLVGLAGLPPQQDVDLLLDPILNPEQYCHPQGTNSESVVTLL